MSSLTKQRIFNNLKNIPGWRTKRKILVFCADDYGNVRINSEKSRKALDELGLKPIIPSDIYDTLETGKDLEELFKVLRSVRDQNGNHAVFTPFAMPCNIDFEKIIESGFKEFHYELLPTTFEKLSQLQPEAYNGTWELWLEAMEEGLFKPQFHGREHLNLKVFKEKLKEKDFELMSNLKNRSYARISKTGYSTIDYTAAFDFSAFSENEDLSKILADGIRQFSNVFGVAPSVFTPPMSRIHPMHLPDLHSLGIRFLNTTLLKRQHMGEGKYKRVLSFTGQKLKAGQTLLIRNVIFEPTENQSGRAVELAIDQIEAAFYWNKPAIISTHRVNFCGYIDEANRKNGLRQLRELLTNIVKKWPDVEFMSADGLGAVIEREKPKS